MNSLRWPCAQKYILNSEYNTPWYLLWGPFMKDDNLKTRLQLTTSFWWGGEGILSWTKYYISWKKYYIFGQNTIFCLPKYYISWIRYYISRTKYYISWHFWYSPVTDIKWALCQRAPCNCPLEWNIAKIFFSFPPPHLKAPSKKVLNWFQSTTFAFFLALQNLSEHDHCFETGSLVKPSIHFVQKIRK